MNRAMNAVKLVADSGSMSRFVRIPRMERYDQIIRHLQCDPQARQRLVPVVHAANTAGRSHKAMDAAALAKPTTFLSATTLRAEVTADDFVQPGSTPVTVTNR